MAERKLLPFEVDTPEGYVDKTRAEGLSVVGAFLGDNDLSTSVLDRFVAGEISEAEVNRAFEFRSRILALILSEFSEQQRIEFIYVKTHPYNSDDHNGSDATLELLEQGLSNFKRQYESKEVYFSNDDIINIDRKAEELRRLQYVEIRSKLTS